MKTTINEAGLKTAKGNYMMIANSPVKEYFFFVNGEGMILRESSENEYYHLRSILPFVDVQNINTQNILLEIKEQEKNIGEYVPFNRKLYLRAAKRMFANSLFEQRIRSEYRDYFPEGKAKRISCMYEAIPPSSLIC